MTLPTVARPQQGIFVYRRLRALSQLLPVRALRPQPWFPGLRKHKLDLAIKDAAFPMDCRRMPYLPGVAKSLDGRWMARCVNGWLDELKIDPRCTVLDAHFGYPEGVACHLAAKQWKIPYIVTLRGVEQEWFRQPRVRDQIVGALNEAAGVIAVSESLRAAAAAVGVDANRIHVIPNGCDTTTFYPGDRLAARRKLNLDEQKTLLVCVANVKRVKGHDRLIQAMARLRHSLDFQLICIGNQHEQPDFAKQTQRMVDTAGLAENVRFTGSLPEGEIADYLRAADLFVLASRREGCCNAILEAMACGTPVVATAVGDNPKLAARYLGIRIADADDPTSFQQAILDSIVHLNADSDRERFQPKPWNEIAVDCMRLIRQAGDHLAIPE